MPGQPPTPSGGPAAGAVGPAAGEPRPGVLAPTRRGFLRLLGGGAALAAVARIPGVPATARAAAQAGAPAFFDPDRRRVLGAVVARMVDSGGEPVDPTRALATIDALCASLDPALTQPLPLLVSLVEWSPPLFQLRFARFTSLPPEEQDACLRDWMTSRLGLRRMGFAALKNLSMLGWYSQDESWASVGYLGPLIDTRRRS